MCDQTEISYSDEEVVWVKLGNCWWPGEVVAPEKLSPDLLQSFRKPPIATVKFFQEDAYEYVKNVNSIYKYQCDRKHEFINKGLSLYRTKHGHMEKFPEDVILAETKVGGDKEILTREEFQQTKKESYAGLFGTPAKKTPGSVKKGRGRPSHESHATPVRRMREKTDYKVHILVQGSKPTVPEPPSTPVEPATPSTSNAEIPTPSEPESVELDKSNNTPSVPNTILPSTPTTPQSSAGNYACHACSFSTTRLNVLILHNKSHSVSYVPYTPTPIKKKPIIKSKSPAKTPSTSKTPKQRKLRKEKPEKPKNNKRPMEDNQADAEIKKAKTNEEIKSSLLADWDDDVDEESNDESAMGAEPSPEVPLQAHSPEIPRGALSPEIPVGAESPAVPTPAILPEKANSSDKPEPSSDSNKYEFCEDEDWPVEADAGRKIPRVKNPVRTEESKSISIDEDDMAREVAELLNRTAMPELPSVPEPLKVEENFPEASLVKSPDKNTENSSVLPDGATQETPPTKIFKTKTFFRSRHSRSQDAIGKYVAEQLNNVEKMDIADNDLNGSDNVSSPEPRDSPPIEQVKVARLAPKIQLKRMKAEAQLREKEKNRFEPSLDPYSLLADIMVSDDKPESPLAAKEKESDTWSFTMQDVAYPNQQIKPATETESLAETTSAFANYDVSTEGEDTRETMENTITDNSEESQETTQMHHQEYDIQSNKNNITESIQNTEILYKENITSIEVPGKEVPDQMLSDTPEPTEPEEKTEQPEPYMNESTASAVDALLSVSREADRVTRTISDDPPEDLFEDDNGSINSNINGDTNDIEHESELGLEADPVVSQSEEENVVYEKVVENDEESLVAVAEEDHHPSLIMENDEKAKEIVSTDNEENKLALHEETTNCELPAIDEELSAAKKLDFKQNSSNIEVKPFLHDEFDDDGLEIEDQPTVPELTENSVMSENGDIPLQEEPNKLPIVQEMPVTQEIHVAQEIPDSDVSVTQEALEHNVYFGNELHIPEESEQVMIHSGFSENEEEIVTTHESEIVSEECVYLQNEEIPTIEETEIPIDNNPDEYITNSDIYQNEEVVTTHDVTTSLQNDNQIVSSIENVPSESDLQIAEALINLPATALHNKNPTEHENHILTNSFEMDNVHEEIIPASEDVIAEETVSQKTPESLNDDSLVRFETEQEKSENLNAAQSLLHMSESIDHTINIAEPMDTTEITDKPSVILNTLNNGINSSFEQITKSEFIKGPEKATKPFLANSSKLLQILEEPSKPRFTKISPTRQIVMHGKEKILNFDVAKSSFKSKTPKQKIIIRRTTSGKSVLNNLNEIPSQENLILSRSNPSQDGSSVQRFTIQTASEAPSDTNTIIIQQNLKKLPNLPTKLQKIKPQTSLITPISEPIQTVETSTIDNAMFDINSMPIVLSEDFITAESIEKMPFVMSDGNINPIVTESPQIPKVMKPKINRIENEKITVTSMPKKSDAKTTLLVNSVSDGQNKGTTPNILSKSSKLRGAKPMLVIDKTTGKQKIIMTKSESIKELKQVQQTPTMVPKTQTLIQKIPTFLQKQPTLIQKAPTLIKKAPTLIQKAPTLIQKAPTLIQKTPTLIQRAPVLIQKTPTLIQKTQTLLQKSPTIVKKTPTLVQKSQTLVQQTPTLIQTTPTLIQTTQQLIQTTPTLIQTTPTLIQTAPTLIQAAPHTHKKSNQAEKFIILPTQNTGRTQKIVIDPQTGKAHMILSKPNEPSSSTTDNKPVSAKLMPSKTETNAPGNTVMIITNAQGTQSRIVLTPEHEKILFPNKQQPKTSQLKTFAHRITTSNTIPNQLKTVLTPPLPKSVAPKTPTKIVPKQKNAIITSKGQLIVGGRVTTTAQNIAPMPEIRPVAKRLAQTEPRKLVQAIQKTNSEPIIFLQQKSGAVMQLTASQFEQLQRTGQIVQKAPAQPAQERVIIQKSRTIIEAGSSQKSRTRKNATQSPTPAKKSKHHEIAIAPAPARRSPVLPALTPIVPTNISTPLATLIASAPPSPPPIPAPPPPIMVTIAPVLTATSAPASSSTFSELDNFEEMLPSTAIARQPPPEMTPAPPTAPEETAPADPAAAALADGQLLAVPGEHFGGPVGSFYLCVEEGGQFTPIDNRPLVLENNQLMPMSEVVQPSRRDILSAALANSDVFHADGDAPDFRDLNANVSVHCRVSETSSTLHQPIMTPQEVPSVAPAEPPPMTSLEDGLAVIGVTPHSHSVPTSLELPITVTDPRIAVPNTFSTTLMPSPGANLCYVSTEESVGPISMPLLTEEEDVGSGGKSMPILTDDLGERTVSSVESESALGSPASLGAEDGSGVTWARRLLTPGSDASDLSVEIPLQPSIQISVGDLSEHT